MFSYCNAPDSCDCGDCEWERFHGSKTLEQVEEKKSRFYKESTLDSHDYVKMSEEEYDKLKGNELKAPPRPEKLPCNESCPKCGSSDINLDYKKVDDRFYNLENVDSDYYNKVGMNNVEVIKEHLRCGCRTCQYFFILEVRD